MDRLFTSVVVNKSDEVLVTILCLCGQQSAYIRESDKVLVTILCLCGQQFAYI